ncbi:NHL domain-containing protein [Striga hermonthica]|uniref:NHL domain-containing protein n=1 Tax=Striga hermonthica TaxID=68872 RepID=A0A9N7NM20_STRHE|nr:NHL domain-containing protein [Striga hermonthica]
MHFGFRRMRHIFRVMPKIYPGTLHHLSEAGVNGLASARSTGRWCNASSNISRRLDLAGCQERRYSSISNTKRPTSSDEFWSVLRSSLNQPRGPYWCWLNSSSGSKTLFKEDQVFLVLVEKFDDGSLGAKQSTVKMFEIAKSLQQRYSFLQVLVVQHGKSMCLNNASKHFLQRIIKEYVTFPILLFNKQSISEVWMQKAPCVIICKGFSQNPMIYPSEDVDLKTLDEAIRGLKVKHDTGDNVNDAKSTWVKPIEVIKEPDVCSASRNLLFSFPGCISVEEGGDRLFLSDVNHHRVIVFDNHGKILDAIGSSPGFEDGEFETAKLMRPAASFYLASEDSLFFIDSENHAIRKADMERRVVETVFPVTGDSKRSKSLWNWILDKIWMNRNIKPNSEEFNFDSFLFPWHILKSSDDDTYVLDQSFGTLWTIDLESGSVKEVIKEPSKIMEKCGQAILEKCAPLEHLPADWLQQRAHSTCSFEGVPYAGLMSSVATCGDHILMSDTVGQTVVKFGREAGLAMSFKFTNFGVLGLPYWIVSSLERVYSADDPYGDPDHSQCFRLLPGRVDITVNIDIPQHAELIERPQEGCIWRQARGSAIEISGVDNKAESSEKVGIAQQWYDEIDNLSFSVPQEESSTKEEIGRAGEEVQEGKLRIGCTINTSPGTSEAVIYAAVYLRLKKESNKQVNSRENKASRIADILDAKKKFKRDLLIEQLMRMSDRDLEELIFLRPLHVRLKFNCRDHPKSDQNTKGVVLTDSLVEVHVTL